MIGKGSPQKIDGRSAADGPAVKQGATIDALRDAAPARIESGAPTSDAYAAGDVRANAQLGQDATLPTSSERRGAGLLSPLMARLGALLAPRAPAAVEQASAPAPTSAAMGVQRHPDTLPAARMDELVGEAWQLAKSRKLASAADIDAWMGEKGVKHIADRARLHDAIYQALGMDR